MSCNTCITDGTQPRDTGQQLAASNVSFDDTLINSGCPHVQCVLETMGKRQIDHIADISNPHEVNISQIPHSLEDHSNVFIPATVDGEVLTVQAGVWGSAAPVTGTTDHLLLSNIGTNSHEIIDEHIGNITLNPHMITPSMIEAEPENANIQAHIADITTNPHQVTYQNIGGTPPERAPGENILINGDFRVNQRGFDGNWAGLAGNAYGYDGWFNVAGTHIRQNIEPENLISVFYTLSWEGGGTGTWAGVIGVSPLSVAYIPGQDFIQVPNTSTNIKLELGTVATPFQPGNIQQELAMCQRFYEVGTYSMTLGLPLADFTVAGMYTNVGFKVEKRVVPIITGTVNAGVFSTTTESTSGAGMGRSDQQANRTVSGTYIADAEIT